MTRGDPDEVQRCRGPANKLALSIQLCTLRSRGHFLPDTGQVPAVVLEVLALQLGLLPMPITDYPRDERSAGPISSAFVGTSGSSAVIVVSGSCCSNTSRALLLEQLRAEGHAIDDATLALTTPLRHKHLNPFGRYHFDLTRMRQSVDGSR